MTLQLIGITFVLIPFWILFLFGKKIFALRLLLAIECLPSSSILFQCVDQSWEVDADIDFESVELDYQEPWYLVEWNLLLKSNMSTKRDNLSISSTKIMYITLLPSEKLL